jgi:HPt (histidine-containing phosphotransfer) domain-containing protein
MTAEVSVRRPVETRMDSDVLSELRELGESVGEAFLPGLVADFVSSTDPLFDELEDAIEHGDATTIGRIAHSIKGSSSGLGGLRLTASCNQMESVALTGQRPCDWRDLLELHTDYDDMCRMLERDLLAA